MKWANKIMSNNQDHSQSKLSNRSLSKFRKINLQKSDGEISSNQHLEKSVLKLASVQKIKTLNLNHSFIENYVASSQLQSQRNSSEKFNYNPASQTQRSKQVIQNLQSYKSLQIQYPKILDFGSQAKLGLMQGFGIFHKEENIKTIQQRIINSQIHTQNPQNLSPELRLKRLLIKMQQTMVEYKEVAQNIKKGMNEAVSSGFMKVEKELSNCVREFGANFQNGIQQMIKMTSRQKKGSQFKIQNLVKTSQIFARSPQNEIFYKIVNFHQEQVVQNDGQKQVSKSRPNKFKNHFKQIIDDSNNENLLTKNQVYGGIERSGMKIVRKQTNPVNRVNSLLRNDSSVINEDSYSNANDKSISSIRYSKVNDRSASKSVRKLHEKLVLMKNIFNGTSPINDAIKGDDAKILVQNNS